MNIKKVITGTVLCLAVACSMVIGSMPSASAKTSSLSGTVNCGGTTVYYSTTRAISQTGNGVSLQVTNLTGYYWTTLGISQNNGYETYVGAQIFKVATGALVATYAQQSYTRSVTSHWAVPKGVYVVNTQFKFNARMDTYYRGTCDNAWGGTVAF